MEYDFSGYATRNDLQCSDGLTIRAGAFKDNDGKKVPLCWQHGHTDPMNVIGHAILENRKDGVYAYCSFNDTEPANHARRTVEHGDVAALSIYANQLKKQGANVVHGNIRELSLVLAGANPGAFIDNIVLRHGDSETVIEDEAIIYADQPISLAENQNEGETMGAVQHDSDHNVQDVLESMNDDQRNVVYSLLTNALSHTSDKDDEEDLEHADDDKTVEDVFNSMTEEQQNVVYFLLGQAMENGGSAQQSDENNSDSLQHDQKGTDSMNHNIFEQNKADETTLSHSDIENFFDELQKPGKRPDSLKHTVEEFALQHGIENIDTLFPDAKAVTNTPDWLARRTEWVQAVIGGTNHTPFSRIKSVYADITPDEARAKGYIKGSRKEEEFFAVAKRVTTPQTIYKKQQLDRDDILDITDFDVVMWLKGEMRLMLEEELARAVLVGDGRSNAENDKIKETNIRPIATDDELYVTTVYVNVDDVDSSADEIVDALTLQRRHYRGSGNPTFFTSETWLSKMLLIKDKMNRRIYASIDDLKVALRVKDIVAIEVFENLGDLIGILVNLQDYTIGADRGGDVSLFDDFDIDFNQYKYLIETRVSGALTKPKSALVVRKTASTAALVTPTAPTFASNVVTVPTVTGVTYKNKISGATLTTASPVTLTAGQSLTVIAVPASANYYFATNADDEWNYEHQA